jgi:hypothetical protein
LIHWYTGNIDGRDSAGTNNGVLEAGVTAGNPGEVGGAFLCNGVNGGVSLGDVPDLNFTPDSSFSIEAWFNSFGPSPGANDGQVILRLNYVCGLQDQSIGMGNNQGSPFGQVFFNVRDANGVGAFVVTPIVSSNQFHHVVGVRQANGGSRTVRIYLDGVLVDSQPDPSTGILAANVIDYIGRRPTCGSDNVFNGLIDEVSIYNRALTDAEVQALFAAGSAGKCFFAIDWFKVAGGGGTSSDATRSLSGTIGQQDAGGPSTNGQFLLVGGFWALPIAVQNAGAPTLRIVPSGPGFATISWTPPTRGFHLQASDSLTLPNWSNAPSGPTNPVTVPATLPQRFYRLIQP